MITLKSKGDFKKTYDFLNLAVKPISTAILRRYGEKGVEALAASTPVSTGLTARSWRYEIEKNKERISLSFYNDNVNKGVPIAIILQYGHGTRNGGYVKGRDYINPAIRPIFDEMAETIWKEVSK